MIALALLAAAVTGLLAGASLDQSIKQLPARRRIGVAAYAAYASAADLGNGIVWYAVLGVGAALLCVATAVGAWAFGLGGFALQSAIASGALAVLHSLATSRAAPTMFRTRRAQNDAGELGRLFDRFARWQALRALLQLLNFAAALAAALALTRR